MHRLPSAVHATPWLLCLLLATGGPSAEPVDLSNPEPRPVAVRFELSRGAAPAPTRAVFGEPIVAWLTLGEDPSRRVLIVPGRAVETLLLAEHAPVPASFSDFVWSFDVATGHVLSATVSGEVERSIRWGLGTARMKAHVRFEMDTLRTVGFRPERRLLGERVAGFCPAERLDGCIVVAPSAYDAETGYVNAVGWVQVESRLVRLRTFSTLGEALLSELDPASRPAARPPVPRAGCPLSRPAEKRLSSREDAGDPGAWRARLPARCTAG